ncbi:MAG: DUF4124 domain-containing protein [Gammaproteobacteria bacterium]
MLMLVAVDSAQAANQKKPRRTSRPADNTGIVYRWVDNNGVVHYGDQVPPEYAPMDRDVLNQQGVALRTEQGLLTPEELAAEAKAKAEKEAAQAAARRDKVLLSTYLSVEEIEGLRDRRIELIDGQISVITIYLQSLKDNLKLLQAEAGRYKPYSQDPDAEPIDEKLAKEISDTVDSISLYEKTLQDTRSRQARVVTAFDADIARFQELKAP